MLVGPTYGMKRLPVVHEWMFQGGIERTSDEFPLQLSASGFDGFERCARGLQCQRGVVLQGNAVALLLAEESTHG